MRRRGRGVVWKGCGLAGMGFGRGVEYVFVLLSVHTYM